MNQNDQDMISSKMDDKELIDGALVCIRLIEQHLEGQTMESLEKNFLVYDAVSYRMIVLGKLIKNVSGRIKEKHDKFYWFISCFEFDEPIEVAWDLYEANTTDAAYCESFKSIYEELEKIYLKEFSARKPKIKKSASFDFEKQSSGDDDKLWDKRFDDNYKYAIKTKNSIWTVRK